MDNRRALNRKLSLSALTAVGWLYARHFGRQKRAEITWEQFTAILSLETVKAPSSINQVDDQVVQRLARAAESVSLVDVRRVINPKNQLGELSGFNVFSSNQLFEIGILNLEKNEDVILHNHPNYSGISLCVSGEITVTNFNQLRRVSNNSVILGQVSSSRLQPGQTTTLTQESRNIHVLKSHEVSQIVDVFIPPPRNRELPTQYVIEKYLERGVVRAFCS